MLREGLSAGVSHLCLQGGEDAFFTTEYVAGLVAEIKKRFPDCALTLSLGEREREDFQVWFDAGADRYLLRHETASKTHYEKIHPPELSYEHRMRCLRDLKEIGYQVGCGFMVESPCQTTDDLITDMRFIRAFQPHMVGIGPFIPHHDTPFADRRQGSLEKTLTMIALIRLTLPQALIPATTALGTIHPRGREMGLQAGGNVVMPNLSPVGVRKQYMLYDNKICTGDEAAECIACMTRRVGSVGYQIVTDRGDWKEGGKNNV
jgi:biotin synthase